ncbi:NTP transferase domain-containing protein [Actinopolymorpha singaporensis]|uniref:Choline kinase n=1 Tax=Actinopolymorpha singaporensis TaxID=117157 RepID=A0A1H1STG2_9ACTN|nr:phosphocholine cytidylyltransferase family protein [Actinopolymorpha singaporensis]SDS51310.1 Choline kinase [Actinopolymorpha singaporensis]
MIGLVLAAGTGRRLRPYTDTLPKALVPLAGEHRAEADYPLTPLDTILANFARVGVTDVAVVVGYAAQAVHERRDHLERTHGVTLDLIHNDRATTWNNCYSLWCARHLFPQGCLLANGDTVHPVQVEHALLAAVSPGAGAAPDLLLALDTVKPLAEEEMKVVWSPDRGVTRITKELDPGSATGEYIGVSLIGPAAAEPLTAALEETWRKDPTLYYEDGYQAAVDAGFRVDVAPIGDLPWVEIDDHADLARSAEVLAAIAGTDPDPAPDPTPDPAPGTTAEPGLER